MSYELTIALPAPPSPRALREALALADLRGLPAEGVASDAAAWANGGFALHREELSTRTTSVSWNGASLEVVVRALASREDCDLALRVIEAAARLGQVSKLHADYFGDIDLEELRRLHPTVWMDEQAASGTRVLVSLIKDDKGPMEMPGPRRSSFIGERLLGELETAGPESELPARVIESLRRIQWGVPPNFRDAAVFVSGGDIKNAAAEAKKPRPTRFAVWLPGEALVIPKVDYVALRASEGEVLMVPAALVADLAGPLAEPLDECQLLVAASGPDEWRDIVARARPFATGTRKSGDTKSPQSVR